MQPIENIYRVRHFCELKRRVTKTDWFSSAMKVFLFRFLLWGPTLPCHFVLPLAKINEEPCWCCIWEQAMVSVRNCHFPWALYCDRPHWIDLPCTGGQGASERRGGGQGEQGRHFLQIHSPGLRFSLAKINTSACGMSENSWGKPTCWESRSLWAKPERQQKDPQPYAERSLKCWKICLKRVSTAVCWGWWQKARVAHGAAEPTVWPWAHLRTWCEQGRGYMFPQKVIADVLT